MSTSLRAVGVVVGAGFVLKRLLDWYERYESDAGWLALAEQVRLSLEPPAQSAFRVVAVVPYGRRLFGEYVVGTNDEAGHIQASICAERSAFVQLALRLRRPRQRPRRARSVFIVTDSSKPIMPGLLCREYMLASAYTDPDETTVLCASAGLRVLAPRVTLAELFPRASLYTRLNGREQVLLGTRLKGRLQRPTNGVACVVYDAALKAAQSDDRDDLHPIRFGAAAGSSTIKVAFQRKALEYGATLDAVSQLAPFLDKLKRDEQGEMWLCMVDHFGVAHTPFAAARAFLAEHGHAGCRVLYHGLDGSLNVVLASDLAPAPPDFQPNDLG